MKKAIVLSLAILAVSSVALANGSDGGDQWCWGPNNDCPVPDNSTAPLFPPLPPVNVTCAANQGPAWDWAYGWVCVPAYDGGVEGNFGTPPNYDHVTFPSHVGNDPAPNYDAGGNG